MSHLISRIKSLLQDRHRLTAIGLLAVVILLGAFLRFYHLGDDGVGNTYYAATVKSMLVSWHNFFFAAFEPGGSVSVDKPPLGFWIQAISAYFLSVNGFALALPNAIAGVLSIFVLYKLVRRPFGVWAGLATALALAVMPVAISTERNNTIDGLLVLVLLLAAWAFLQSVYSGKLRWLFLGVFIVGLGFNIKMLQAFMPLPAFYAIYFFGVKRRWWRKLLELALATVLLLVVSFSWAVVVDLVPAADRPYVDSTSKNTVMELIFGHNGIERLTSFRQRIGLDGGQDGLFGPDGPSGQQPGNRIPDGTIQQPLPGQNQPPADLLQGNQTQLRGTPGMPRGNAGGSPTPQNNGAGGGQPGGSMDFGTAGALRLFTQPLVGEASWLLPFVLVGLSALAVALWKLPFGDKHVAAILWAGWLLPELIYFTFSTGLMHAYYLIMLGAPIAALAAMTLWAFWQIIGKYRLSGWISFLLLVAATLLFQGLNLWGKSSLAPWAVGIAGLFFGVGLCFFAFSMLKSRFSQLAFICLLAAMLVAPSVWSALTTFNSSPNGALPAAGPSGVGNRGSMPGPAGNASPVNGDQGLLDYLLANTQPGSYLLATDRANDAAGYILTTGRPVLTFGGFLGEYNEISVEQLAALVKNDQLRFVLSQGLQGRQEIAQWVQQNCKPVNISGSSSSGVTISSSLLSRYTQTLYDCGR